MDLNKVMLAGRLTRDPELKYIASGTAICKLSLATSRKYKSGEGLKEEVCFVDITAWGKTAENCGQYLTKGSAAFVEGYLKLEQWESQGQKRSKLSVVAESIQFLSSNKKSNQEQNNRDVPGCDSDSIPF